METQATDTGAEVQATETEFSPDNIEQLPNESLAEWSARVNEAKANHGKPKPEPKPEPEPKADTGDKPEPKDAGSTKPDPGKETKEDTKAKDAEEADKEPKEETLEDRKVKVKLEVDGKEEEQEVSVGDLTKTYTRAKQIEAAGRKQMAEAKQQIQDMERFLERGKSNPQHMFKELAGKLGVDWDDVAEEYVYRKYQEKSNPEEYQRYQESQELEQLRREKAELEREKQERERAQVASERQNQIRSSAKAALEEQGLPKDSEWAFDRLLVYARAAADKGINANMQQLAGLVKRDWDNHQRSLYSSSNAEDLLKNMTPEAREQLKAALGAEPAAPAKRKPNTQILDERESKSKKQRFHSWAEIQKAGL